ncbi:MAG: aldo/keto reductase [Deinococcota bacterium]
MNTRNFGRTGVKVSPLCLGCMNFGGRTDAATSKQIIAKALEADINFIDTANVYGHDPEDFNVGRGRSEQIVGEALKELGVREQVFLASKAHFPMNDDPNAQGNSRKHIISSCEASLKRLKTDYIDLFQLHHPSNDIPIDETLHALDDLVRRGLVRYIGTSSFAAWQLMESLWCAHDLKLNRVVSEQPAYNLLDRRIERELVPMAQTYGLAIIPWSPLAGGFLTGKYQPNQELPSDSRFARFWKGLETRHFNEAALNVLTTLTNLSNEKGCTPAQLATAWVMQQAGITSVIMGPRTETQLESYLGSLELSLSSDELAQLDAAAPAGRTTVPYYGADGMMWRTWGPHQHRW